MSTENPQNLLDTIHTKIAELLDDFRNEEVSREHFNIVYARYYKQLELAYRAAKEDAKDDTSSASTFRMEDMRMTKALGIGIYHHASKCIILTLGNFDLSPEKIAPVLSDYQNKLDDDSFIEPQTKQLDSGLCLLFVTEHLCTAIAVFREEPNPHQIMVFGRIMRDFEHANQDWLETSEVDVNKLAQPFISVVKVPK